MAAKVIPSPDGKCLCNCGETCKPGRAFYSNACQKRHYRRKYAHVRTSTLTMSGFSPKRKAVKCIDPECATPYFISRHEYDTFAADYRKMGIEVEINGQKMLC